MFIKKILCFNKRYGADKKYKFSSVMSLLCVSVFLSGQAEPVKDLNNISQQKISAQKVLRALRNSILVGLVPASVPIIKLFHSVYTTKPIPLDPDFAILRERAPSQGELILNRLQNVEGQQSMRQLRNYAVGAFVAQMIWAAYMYLSESSVPSE